MTNTDNSSAASTEQFVADVQPNEAEQGQDDEPIAGPSNSTDTQRNPTASRGTSNDDQSVSFFKKKITLNFRV